MRSIKTNNVLKFYELSKTSYITEHGVNMLLVFPLGVQSIGTKGIRKF